MSKLGDLESARCPTPYLTGRPLSLVRDTRLVIVAKPTGALRWIEKLPSARSERTWKLRHLRAPMWRPPVVSQRGGKFLYFAQLAL